MKNDDPNELAWMAGFPPPADKVIRFGDGTYLAWPQQRWSFNHMEQLGPTKAVWRGPGAARKLPSKPQDLTSLVITLSDGQTLSWDEMLTSSHTDALAVLHRGQLVYERYLGASGPHVRHAVMSCNKSMVGAVAECLIDDGTLDETMLVSAYVPELSKSAWADATVRQVLDMVIGMKFYENYLDPASDVWDFMRSTGMVPSDPNNPLTISEFLPRIAKEGEHGKSFAYREPNIFVLGWILRRVAGRDLTTLASELVWQHIGAEHDWLYMVEGTGAETTALATLRDFVRFGELFCNRGKIDGVQVLPPAVIRSVLGGGDQAVFARANMETLPDWSYRSQWWIRHIDGRICPTARGAYGQYLYVDPTNELVIARFGSAQHAPSALLDHIVLPTFDAITAAVAN